ncbi:hypothetical protein VKT23_007643 [Stygiomarasmius scandens]|uniref:Uncharacterized protein n=1 Tax=Marasmiellus scandens TaxID=2682957 RepID=A0ABR1JL14_9AGAR
MAIDLVQTQPIQKNIFFYCIPAWGHTKPIPAFSYRIMETRPDVVVTVFTFSALYPRLLKEIEKMPKEFRERFFVIDVCGSVANPQLPVQAFDTAFEALWKGEPVTCLSSGKVWTGVPRPVVAVVDASVSLLRVLPAYLLTQLSTALCWLRN